MNEKKKIVMDELFIRAMRNFRRHVVATSDYDTMTTFRYWEQQLRDQGITFDFKNNFYVEDERMLSMFILRWS